MVDVVVLLKVREPEYEGDAVAPGGEDVELVVDLLLGGLENEACGPEGERL